MKLATLCDSPSTEAHRALSSANENDPPHPHSCERSTFSPITIQHVSETPPPSSPSRFTKEDSTMGTSLGYVTNRIPISIDVIILSSF